MANPPVSNSDLFEVFGGQMNELFMLPAEIWQNIAKNTLDKLEAMRRKMEQKAKRFENDPEYQEEWRKWAGLPSSPQPMLTPEASLIVGEEAWRHIRIFFSDDDLGRLYRDTAIMLDTIPNPYIPIAIAIDFVALVASYTDIQYSNMSDNDKMNTFIISLVGLAGAHVMPHVSLPVDLITNSGIPIITSEISLRDLQTVEGWDKLAHTNPYLNQYIYHGISKHSDNVVGYPPKCDYITTRIPSDQNTECVLIYISPNVFDDSEKKEM